jgi:hypothetical protein
VVRLMQWSRLRMSSAGRLRGVRLIMLRRSQNHCVSGMKKLASLGDPHGRYNWRMLVWARPLHH